RRLKVTSAFLTAAISGGAALRPIAFAVALRHDVAYSYCIIVMAFSVGALFPLWLLLNPYAKKIVDPGARHCSCTALRKSRSRDSQHSKARDDNGALSDRPRAGGASTERQESNESAIEERSVPDSQESAMRQ